MYNVWSQYHCLTVNSYLYCGIRPEGLSYNAEHDMLAIAKLFE